VIALIIFQIGNIFCCPFNAEPQQGVQAAAKKTSLGVL